MTNPALELSFIVPVRNDAAGVTRCLHSIATAAKRVRHEVIVVDNGSIDGSTDIASGLGAKVFTRAGRVAALRNAGARAAAGSLLAFVDADHEVDRRWAEAALDLTADPEIAAVGAPYHPPPSANWVQRTYNLLRDHRPGLRDATWLGSGNLAVRRSAFDAVGGFDETLETCEDVDLCQRLKQAGYRVLSDSRLRSTHYGDPSTLRRLFASELWRGRDNLRVSLRALALRELPSVAIPAFDLVAVLVAAIAILLRGRSGVPVAGAAFALIAGFALLRATRMATRAEGHTVRQFVQACSVAVLYDLARAFALIVRMPHRRATGPVTHE